MLHKELAALPGGDNLPELPLLTGSGPHRYADPAQRALFQAEFAWLAEQFAKYTALRIAKEPLPARQPS